MVQTRLGYLRPTRNQNPEFSTSSIQELDFSNILPQELEYSTSCKKYLELFSVLSRFWLQDVENSRSYSSLSEAHPCKLTFSFPVVCALNTSDIYLPVHTRTLTTTQAYSVKSVALFQSLSVTLKLLVCPLYLHYS